MNFEEYRGIDALNQSALKLILKSPLHYWQEYVNPDRTEKETPSLKIGKALHSAILEQQVIHDAPPKVDRRTKAGKETYARWQAQLPPNTIILTKDEKDRVDGMIKSLNDHPLAYSYLYPPAEWQQRKPELTLTWEHEYNDIPCKARLDQLNIDQKITGNAIIVDLKTTTDASAHGFAKAVANYSYHVQVAFYMQAVKANFPKMQHVGFVFIAVESQPPFTVGVYELHAHACLQGERDIRQALFIYEQVQANTMFDEVYYPHYNHDECVSIGLPKWAQDQYYGDKEQPF